MRRGKTRLLIVPPPLSWPEGLVAMALPITFHDASKLTGYSLSTVRRWAAGAPMPICAFRLIMLHVYGLMPGADDSWRGFRVRGNAIITPEGLTVTSQELAELRFALDHRENLRRYVLSLRKRLTELDPDYLYRAFA